MLVRYRGHPRRMAFQRCLLLVALVVFFATATADLHHVLSLAQRTCTEGRNERRNVKTERRLTTPLHTAVLEGHSVEQVRALLAGEANVNQAMYKGDTALYIAAYKGHLEVVRALLVAGASVDQAEDNGGTPLIMAAEKSHLEGARAGGGGRKRGPGDGRYVPKLSPWLSSTHTLGAQPRRGPQPTPRAGNINTRIELGLACCCSFWGRYEVRYVHHFDSGAGAGAAP